MRHCHLGGESRPACPAPVCPANGSSHVKATRERKIAADAIIYHEGDDADAVHFIVSGEVEVRRLAGEEDVLLAVLRDGQFFGEIGVVQDRPRSTTTTARTDVTLVSVPKNDFLKAFGETNAFALPLLRTLCERLRKVEHLVADHVNPESARAIEVARIVLQAAAPEMEIQIGADGIEIAKLPYIVGRRNHPDDAPHAVPSALLVRPHDRFRIELEHFAIVKHNGHMYVRDLDSHLGTIVNGRRIASFEHSKLAELGFGANLVQAGGVDSPYSFNIVVEKS